MKILVFDDQPFERRAAQIQLKSYNPTIVGDYDKALNLIASEHFDFAMIDLMALPGESYRTDPECSEKFLGKEMPLGPLIVLLAICKGVKKVALVWNFMRGNSHSHPAVKALHVLSEKNQKTDRSVLYCDTGSVVFMDVGIEAIGLSRDEVVQEYELDPTESKYSIEKLTDKNFFCFVKDWNGILKGGVKDWNEILKGG